MWVQELGFLPLDQQSVIPTKDEYPSKLSTLDSTYGPLSFLARRFASRILSFLSPPSLSLTALARRNGRSVIDAVTSFATHGHQT
jgi:hypothetical protein